MTEQENSHEDRSAALLQAARPYMTRAAYALLLGGLAMLVICLCYRQQEIRPVLFGVSCMLPVLGMYLLRGSLRAAMRARWLAVFGIVPALFLLDYLFLQPLPLTLKQFERDFSFSLMWVLRSVILLGVIWYVSRQLGAAPVVAAGQAMDGKRRDLRLAFVAGMLLHLGFVAAQMLVFNSELATQARAAVEQHTGPGHEYYLSAIGKRSTSRGDYYFVLFSVWNEQGLWDASVWCPDKGSATVCK